MSQSGLQAVLNPSEMFLSEQCSDSEFLAGLAVAVIIDGSRAFLIEIQVAASYFLYFFLILSCILDLNSSTFWYCGNTTFPAFEEAGEAKDLYLTSLVANEMD